MVDEYTASSFFEELQSPAERARLSFVPTVSELLEMVSTQYGNAPALVGEDVTCTYAELVELVAKYRAAFDGHAAGNIGVLCENNAQARLWFLACLSSGNTAVMLPSFPSVAELASFVRRFDLAGIAVDEAHYPLTTHLDRAVFCADALPKTGVRARCADPADAAAVFLTSGSSGAPKGVILSQRALMRGAWNGTLQKAGTVFGNRTVSFLPLYHVFGAISGFLSFLYTGSAIHLCPSAREGIRLLASVRPTRLVLVPGLAQVLCDLADASGTQLLGGLHTIICGGAPVPAALAARMQAHGVDVLGGYGLTEAANLTSGNMDPAGHPTSAGKLYPGQQARIINGELWLRGDNLMSGYYGDDSATAAALQDGWLKTGDLAAIDDDGFLTITGRTSNIIALPNGEKVCPEALEQLIEAYECVHACLVRTHADNGPETLAAEVFPNPKLAAVMSNEELKERFAAAQSPADIEALVGELGVEAAPEEVVAFLKEKLAGNADLSDDDLDQVAGGKSADEDETYLSICSAGIYCTFKAIVSACEGKCGASIEGEGMLCDD